MTPLTHKSYRSCSLLLLKNTIQPSKFENLIGFIRGLMDQSVSHLVNSRTPGRGTK